MSARKTIVLFLMAFVCASATPQMALAQKSEPERATPTIVKFEDKTIDVSESWGDAQACLVWDQAGATECFRTAKELDAKIAGMRAGRPELFASCYEGLWLWEHASQGGRLLKFYDRGYWQNLSNWSFSNQTTSFNIGACTSHLADSTYGGGGWYPGDTRPWVYCDHMGSWNDRVSSIKLD